MTTSSLTTRAQRVKEQISLAALVEQELGPPVDRSSSWAKWFCPNHTESDASFTVHLETNSFYCYGACGTGGDLIDYVKWRTGKSAIEAIEHLESQAHILGPVAKRKPVKAKPQTATWEQVERYHHNRTAALPYFVSRGIQPETLDKRFLGARVDWSWRWKDAQANLHEQHCYRYTIPHYMPKDDTRLLQGIIMRRDDAMCHDWIATNPGFVTQVIETEMQRRGITKDRVDAVLLDLLFGPKYYKTPGHNGFIYNSERLFTWDGSKWQRSPLEFLLIQESQMDTIVSEQSGYPAIQCKIGGGSAHKTPEQIFASEPAQRLRKATEHVLNIFIIEDAGEAGAGYAKNMYHALGRGTILKTPAGFSDTNDIAIHGDLDAYMTSNGIPKILS